MGMPGGSEADLTRHVVCLWCEGMFVLSGMMGREIWLTAR